MNPTTIPSLAARHNGAAAVAALLERAATRLSTLGAWTQNEAARDAAGEPVWDPWDAQACCWCPIGAVWAEARTPNPPLRSLQRKRADVLASEVIACLNAAVPVADGELHPAAVWNNEPQRTQAEVVALLRQVAAVVRGEAS